MEMLLFDQNSLFLIHGQFTAGGNPSLTRRWFPWIAKWAQLTRPGAQTPPSTNKTFQTLSQPEWMQRRWRRWTFSVMNIHGADGLTLDISLYSSQMIIIYNDSYSI